MDIYLNTEYSDEGSGLELVHISDVLDVLGKEFKRRAFTCKFKFIIGLIQLSKYKVYMLQ